jgi:hypothetical protein
MMPTKTESPRRAVKCYSVIDGIRYEVLACGHRQRARPEIAGVVPATTRACRECGRDARKKKGA